MSLRKSASHNRTHDGTAQAIRDLLKTSPNDMSCYQIALALGKRQEKVKHALAQMVVVSGGVVARKGPRGVVYGPYRPPEKPQEPVGTKAGRIVIGRGFNWKGSIV